MKPYLLKRLLNLALFFPIIGYGQLTPVQEQRIDSLQLVIKSAQHDSIIIKAWLAWDKVIKGTDNNSRLTINKKIDSLCSVNLEKKLNDK